MTENIAPSAEKDAPVHACPPKGSGVMPCCGRTPFEVSLTDRMTLEPDRVTCRVCTKCPPSQHAPMHHGQRVLPPERNQP